MQMLYVTLGIGGLKLPTQCISWPAASKRPIGPEPRKTAPPVPGMRTRLSHVRGIS